jgi:photosystem II stability/assembly factor-like uncharacterized protein
VFFTSSNVGCTVGDSGTILKTSNGGVNWETIPSQTFAQLSSIHFPCIDTGYAVGIVNGLLPCQVLKTTNGGTDWTIIYSDSTSFLNSVYFPDADTGYIVGTELNASNGVILKTTNGGIDWSSPLFMTSNTLHSVYFIDTETGYIVGDSGTILKTTNGGLVGVNESVSVSKFPKLYPNPAKDKIMIESSVLTEDTYLSIINVNSQEIMEILITDHKTQIDVSNLPPGVYFVKLKNRNTIEVRKIIKE